MGLPSMALPKSCVGLGSEEASMASGLPQATASDPGLWLIK